MDGSLEIAEPIRTRLPRSGGIGVVATLALLLWARLGGTPWVIAWVGCAVALALLTQRVCFQADGPRDLARVVWTVAWFPVLVLRRIPLSTVREVAIGKIPGPNGQPRFVGNLVALIGPRPLGVWTRRTPVAARALGERIARALRVPLRDATDGEDRVRGWEELDLNLGKRLRLHGQEPPAPAVPPGSGIALSTAPRPELALPAQPLSLPALVPPLIALGALGLAFLAYAPPLALLLVPVGILVAVLYGRSLRPGTVAVDGEGLEVRVGGGRSRQMSFAALEELVDSGQRLVLVSDRERLPLPYRFSDPRERELVRTFIERAAIVHPSARGRLPRA